MSNEYGKSCHFPRIAWQCYHDTKAIKPTAFVIWTDGGYNKDMPADFINAEAQSDRRGDASSADLPLIQHEFKWWSSFPDVRTASTHDAARHHVAVDVGDAVRLASGIPDLFLNKIKVEVVRPSLSIRDMREAQAVRPYAIYLTLYCVPRREAVAVAPLDLDLSEGQP